MHYITLTNDRSESKCDKWAAESSVQWSRWTQPQPINSGIVSVRCVQRQMESYQFPDPTMQTFFAGIVLNPVWDEAPVVLLFSVYYNFLIRPVSPRLWATVTPLSSSEVEITHQHSGATSHKTFYFYHFNSFYMF